MGNQPQNLKEDEYAKNEPPVSANDLLAEIEPLGKVSFNGQNVTYCLLNGQKFKLLAEEIT